MSRKIYIEMNIHCPGSFGPLVPVRLPFYKLWFPPHFENNTSGEYIIPHISFFKLCWRLSSYELTHFFNLILSQLSVIIWLQDDIVNHENGGMLNSCGLNCVVLIVMIGITCVLLFVVCCLHILVLEVFINLFAAIVLRSEMV